MPSKKSSRAEQQLVEGLESLPVAGRAGLGGGAGQAWWGCQQPVQVPLAWGAPGLVAGVDEAGRGPLAGPVVAAAVILDELCPIEGLADSKKLSPLRRERLYHQILANALCCSVAQASVEEIDTHNILQATMLAMRRAVAGLRLKPAGVLVDGNRLPALDMPAQAIVKGDATVQAISAASILAKVHRDRLCHELHLAFPQYGFASHKGYGTREHLEALRLHGASVHHRRSFAPVAAVLAQGAGDPLPGQDGGARRGHEHG